MKTKYRNLAFYDFMGVSGAIREIVNELQKGNDVFSIDKKARHIYRIKKIILEDILEYITRSFKDTNEVEFYVEETIEEDVESNE